jgi:hypothetical protein
MTCFDTFFCTPFKFLMLQQIVHDVERVLERFRVSRSTGVVSRVESRHTEDDFFGVGVVGASIAARCHRSIAHKAVRRTGNLNETIKS